MSACCVECLQGALGLLDREYGRGHYLCGIPTEGELEKVRVGLNHSPTYPVVLTDAGWKWEWYPHHFTENDDE